MDIINLLIVSVDILNEIEENSDTFREDFFDYTFFDGGDRTTIQFNYKYIGDVEDFEFEQNFVPDVVLIAIDLEYEYDAVVDEAWKWSNLISSRIQTDKVLLVGLMTQENFYEDEEAEMERIAEKFEYEYRTVIPENYYIIPEKLYELVNDIEEEFEFRRPLPTLQVKEEKKRVKDQKFTNEQQEQILRELTQDKRMKFDEGNKWCVRSKYVSSVDQSVITLIFYFPEMPFVDHVNLESFSEFLSKKLKFPALFNVAKGMDGKTIFYKKEKRRVQFMRL